MQKECKHHGLTEFTEGLTPKCKKCAVEAVQKRRNKISVLYKGGQCSKCGYNKCLDALEFHHLDPSIKEFGIGQKGYTKSWEKIKQELDKCILLCANCHREEHYDTSKIIFDEDTLLKEKQNIKFCNCGKEISYRANQCADCYRISERKIERPSIEQLLNKIGELKSFVKVGEFYGVSDKSISNWLKMYDLPYKKGEIMKYIETH